MDGKIAKQARGWALTGVVIGILPGGVLMFLVVLTLLFSESYQRESLALAFLFLLAVIGVTFLIIGVIGLIGGLLTFKRPRLAGYRAHIFSLPF